MPLLTHVSDNMSDDYISICLNIFQSNWPMVNINWRPCGDCRGRLSPSSSHSQTSPPCTFWILKVLLLDTLCRSPDDETLLQ